MMLSSKISGVIAVAVVLILFVSGFTSLYYLVKMALNRNPGVPFAEQGQSVLVHREQEFQLFAVSELKEGLLPKNHGIVP